MDFSFTSLGCASALPTVNRYPSAHVLQVHGRLFLIDCGEGCQMQMRKYGFSFLKLSDIFISHIHGDHIFGIYGLLSTMSLLGRLSDINIYAPEGFGPILNSFLKNFGESFNYKINHIVLKKDTKELIFDARKYQIYSFPLFHRVECYGFLFKEKEPQLNVKKHLISEYNISLKEIAQLKRGEVVIRDSGDILNIDDFTYRPYNPRSIAYCSDTAPFDSLVDYIKGVDLLYHEATFADDMEDMAKATFHSTAKQAALIAKNANIKKLILGHFSSRYKDLDIFLSQSRSIFENSFIAEQGVTFSVNIVND